MDYSDIDAHSSISDNEKEIQKRKKLQDTYTYTDCERLCWYHPLVPKHVLSDKSFCRTGLDWDIVDNVPMCQKSCDIYGKIKFLFDNSGLPDICWNYVEFNKAKEDLVAWKTLSLICGDIIKFVGAGQNLLVSSEISGNGKTLMASLVVKKLIKQKISSGNYNTKVVKYIYIPKFINDYEYHDKLDWSDERRLQFFEDTHNLEDFDFVVFDGMGYDSKSRVEDITLRNIINTRLTTHKSNMFICYGSINDLRSIYKKRDVDRIIESSVEITLTGKSIVNSDRNKYIDAATVTSATTQE